jgi:hypothetical protein
VSLYVAASSAPSVAFTGMPWAPRAFEGQLEGFGRVENITVTTSAGVTRHTCLPYHRQGTAGLVVCHSVVKDHISVDFKSGVLLRTTLAPAFSGFSHVRYQVADEVVRRLRLSGGTQNLQIVDWVSGGFSGIAKFPL